MNNCKQCRFARWQKTKAGKLHTSGDGGVHMGWVEKMANSCGVLLYEQRK